MTVFDDDFCQMEMQGGTKRFSCKQLGYGWPPPAEIVWGGFRFERISYSKLTDEQREAVPGIIRGARYKPKED